MIREEYPVPKKGVKVTYADDGYINRILYHGEDYEVSDHVEINNVDIGEIFSKWTAPVLLFSLRRYSHRPLFTLSEPLITGKAFTS